MMINAKLKQALLLASLLVTLYLPALSQANITYSVTYEAKAKGFDLEATRTLTKTGKHSYKMHSTFSHFMGSIEETSLFSETPQGQIFSQQYSYQKKILTSKRNESIRFDWANKKATYQNRKKKQRVFELNELSVDKASQQEVIRQALIAGKKTIEVSLIDRHGQQDAHYKVVGEETLTLPAGTFKTLKVSRTNDPKNRQCFLWFSQDKHSLLVQLEQIDEDGDLHHLHLKSINHKPE